MVRYSWGKAEIWPDDKRVRFVPDDSTEVESAREYEGFQTKTERLASALREVDRRALRRSSELLMDSVRLNANATLTFSTAPEIIRGFYIAAAAKSPYLLTGGLLPEDWRAGAYSLADYHVFYHLLQARGLINTFALLEASSSRRLTPPPYNSAALLISRKELIDDAELVGRVNEGHDRGTYPGPYL